MFKANEMHFVRGKGRESYREKSEDEIKLAEQWWCTRLNHRQRQEDLCETMSGGWQDKTLISVVGD